MKKIFFILFALGTLSGCSDWTTPEPMTYADDPAPRDNKSYLSKLRAYKEDFHAVSIAHISAVPNVTSQNQRVTSLPDSLDLICVKNALGADKILRSDIAYVHKNLGTRVFCMIEYDKILNEWKAMIPPGQPDNRTPQQVKEYFEQQMAKWLACLGEYGFQGVAISVTNSETVGRTDFFDAFEEWYLFNDNTPVMIRGNFQYFPNSVFVSDCLYAITNPGATPTLNDQAKTNEDIDNKMRTSVISMAPFVPIDRLVCETAIKPYGDTKPTGVQLPEVARWIVSPLTGNGYFEKAGYAIDNADVDYYYDMNTILNESKAAIIGYADVAHAPDRIYSRIRSAIGVTSAYDYYGR